MRIRAGVDPDVAGLIGAAPEPEFTTVGRDAVSRGADEAPLAFQLVGVDQVPGERGRLNDRFRAAAAEREQLRSDTLDHQGAVGPLQHHERYGRHGTANGTGAGGAERVVALRAPVGTRRPAGHEIIR
jgi:hypothetical protein